MLFIHETLLVYKLEAYKNCKEVKHIMIMIIAMIYIFLSYLIFDQQWKITFRKSSGPPWKSPLPPKNSKSASHPLFDNIENVSAPSLPPRLPPPPPLQKGGGGGGEDTM